MAYLAVVPKRYFVGFYRCPALVAFHLKHLEKVFQA